MYWRPQPRFLVIMIGVVVGLAGDGTADDSQPMYVSATIKASCSVVTEELAFGELGPTEAKEAETTITFTCNAPGTYRYQISAGLNYSSFRRMQGPAGNYIRYHLYRDSYLSQPIDPDINYDVELTSTNLSSPLSIYGRVNAPPPPIARAVGDYDDSVMVTLFF
jgi:spore coat protein U-like protein